MIGFQDFHGWLGLKFTSKWIEYIGFPWSDNRQQKAGSERIRALLTKDIQAAISRQQMSATKIGIYSAVGYGSQQLYPHLFQGLRDPQQSQLSYCASFRQHWGTSTSILTEALHRPYMTLHILGIFKTGARLPRDWMKRSFAWPVLSDQIQRDFWEFKQAIKCPNHQNMASKCMKYKVNQGTH